MKPYEVASFDALERIEAEGLQWRPIRRRFGIRAFGTNAYAADRAGDLVIEEHTEGTGHEELYLVVEGRAQFKLDGESIDAPQGTLVFIREPEVKRVARAEEPGTTVLAVGGWVGRAFEPSRWEVFYTAYSRTEAGDFAGALELMHQGLAERPDDPVLLYHLACIQGRAGKREEALATIRRALELRPDLAERAREDEDLAAISDEL
jgi:mannose-6-phosphate isomerase-like protein (cupin superfamily)